MGTRIQHFDGRFLPDGTTLLYQAELDDPVAGKSTLEWVYVLESPDRYTATMTVIDKNGKRNLAMRLVGTRSK